MDKYNKMMIDLFKKYKSIPEENKIVFYGKFSFIKNLVFFVLKILIGLYFKSYFLIAIALYDVCIGLVKELCSHGLRHKRDTSEDIKRYIKGGMILSSSSVFYLAYVITQMFFPSSYKYNLVIAIIIAAYSFYYITLSIIGVVSIKGKTLLVKEYKLTCLASALNNIVLTQIALLSFTTNGDTMGQNATIGIIVGLIILGIGIYISIDGYYREQKIKDSLIVKTRLRHKAKHVKKG